MRRLIGCLGLLILTAGSAAYAAYAADAQDLTMFSGFSSTSTATGFCVAGESFAGTDGSTSFISGIGLAVSAFSPIVSNPGTDTPTVARLDSNLLCYPSPFKPGTDSVTIAYLLVADQEVKIYILDLTGTIVTLLTANSANRGTDGYSRASWDGKTGFGAYVGNGLYLVKVSASNKVIGSTKVMAIK